MSFRIAMVCACPYPVPQGSQVLLKTTAQALIRRGHDVRLVVYGYGIGEDDSGVPVERCMRIPGEGKTAAGPSIAKPFQDVALLATLRRVVREHGVQIVHAHNYEALAVALAARVRPIVYHAHNAMADELPHFVGPRRLAELLGSTLDRHLPRRADRVIVPHAALRDYLIACGCNAEWVEVVPPAVDADAFELGSVSEAIPPVVYMGNLDAYQNLPLLFEAMALVRNVRPDARLIVATADRREIPEATVVPVSDLQSLRAVLAQDCVVACPRVSWSGYPMKLLNAMAAGRPCVACRSAAHPLEDGVTGLVVPDNDAQAFADALLRPMGDAELRLTLGENARRKVLACHSPEVIATQIEKVYTTLI